MAELVDYRISYGECAGYCTSALTINGSALELVQEGTGVDDVERRFSGDIEEARSRRSASEAAGLQQGNLSNVYGVPDARDEGAVTVRIRGAAGVTEHRYSRGEAPSAFAALDELLSPILLGWIDGEHVRGVRYNDVP
jgi:hypothetical protein